MRTALLSEFRRLVDEPFQHILSEPCVRLLTKLDSAKKIDFVAAAAVNEYLRTAIMPENTLAEKNAIIQFSNNNLVHYGYLKILYEPGKRPSCVFVDASTPEEHFYGFIRKLRLHFANVYTIVGCERVSKIQMDTKSCPLFSFYHADLFANNTLLTNQLVRQCEKIPGNFSEIRKLLTETGLSPDDVNLFERRATPVQDDESPHVLAELHIITWKELPPEVIRHMQSLSFVARYIEYQAVKNPAFSNGMKHFLEDQVVTVEINGEKKERNYGIFDFSRKVQERVTQYVERTKDDELLHILFPEKAVDSRAVHQFFERCQTPDETVEKLKALFDLMRGEKKCRAFTPLPDGSLRVRQVKVTPARSTPVMSVCLESPLSRSCGSPQQRRLLKNSSGNSVSAVSLARLDESGSTVDEDMIGCELFARCSTPERQGERSSPVAVVNLLALGVLKPSPKRSPKKPENNNTVVTDSSPPALAFS